MLIDNEKIITEKFEQLQTIQGYVPYAIIHFMTDDYFQKISNTTLKDIINTQGIVRQLTEEEIEAPLQNKGMLNKFIEQDMKNWLKEHPEYEDIVISW